MLQEYTLVLGMMDNTTTDSFFFDIVTGIGQHGAGYR